VAKVSFQFAQRGSRVLFVALLLVAFAGCSGPTGDKSHPTVTATSIADGATDVSIDPTLTVTFSEKMRDSTINAQNITLSGPAGLVSASVIYSGVTATIVPYRSLDYATTYIFRVTQRTTDQAGNALGSSAVISFTTVAAPDTTSPQVVSTTPTNNATGVAINGAITAVFSEALDCATVTATSFTLDNGAPVAGGVNCTGTTVTFTPSSNLANDTGHTATLTTAITDVAGNPLASDYVWSFITATVAAPPDATAPTVSSTTPAANATGVATNAAVTAVFSEAVDCSTLPANFTLKEGASPVSGTVSCANNSATFTPAAPLANLQTYTAEITTGVTDLVGNALAANFSWSFTTEAAPDTIPPTVVSTTPADADIDIAVNTVISARLSEPVDCATVNILSFLVNGGGAITGTVACSGSDISFTPAADLANGTVYTVSLTTAITDLAGNPLAANENWSFTTAAAAPLPPTDTTAPTVSSVTPADTATGIAVNTVVTAVFDESLDCATVDTSSFTLSDGGAVGGVVNCSGTTVTFTPSTALANSTTYTATLTTAISDLAGNFLASSYSWSFTTEAAPPPVDTIPPTVTSNSPANGASDIATNTIVTAVFSEDIDCTTVTTSSFTLSDGGAVAGSVSCSGNTATFTPGANLADGTTYTATLTSAITDLAAAPNALAADYTWTFTTKAVVPPPPSDTTAPTVSSVTPANGATGVDIGTQISVLFSEPVDCLTVNGSSFVVNGGAVGGTVSCSNDSASFSPSAPLANSTVYTATLSTTVSDQAGNPMAADYNWSFTTAAAPDTTPPTVVSTTPADGATGIDTNTLITASFSEPVDCTTVTASSFTVDSGSVTGSVSCSGNTATFTPTALLKPGVVHNVLLTTAISDLAPTPNFLTATGWSFTTRPDPWIKQVGSSSHDDVRAVTLDTSGNVYVAGDTLGDMPFNASAGGWDLFVSKYDSAGNTVWATPAIVQIGSSADDNVRGIAVDSAGDIYIAGYSAGNPITGSVSTTFDAFLIKLSGTDGSVLWSRTLSTDREEVATRVAVDSADNVYITGYTYGSLDGRTPNGTADLFLAKYDSAGTKQWVTQFGAEDTASTTDGDYFVSGVAVDGSNVLITGTVFDSVNAEDVYVVKYNSAGTQQWIQQFDHNGSSDNGGGVAVDGSGNVYVACTTQDTAGAMNIYLRKYDATGTFLVDTPTFGASGINDVAYDVAVDGSGNVYVTGYTDGNLGSNVSSGGKDMYLLKYNSSLAYQWVRQLGTGQDDVAYGIVADSAGDTFLAGYTLGTLPANTSKGLSDGFVLKYNAAGVLQ
jgi:methionine-rich copper-binding protein CopC